MEILLASEELMEIHCEAEVAVEEVIQSLSFN